MTDTDSSTELRIPRCIDLAFCINDAYADYVCVAVKSVCENNRSPQLVIHVLSDNLSTASVDKLHSVVDPYSGVRLKYYEVDDSHLRGLKDTWSVYTWYRVLLPSVLPTGISRVLYLDADIIVEDDLSSLWTLDMTDKAIGCAIDVLTHDPDSFARCKFPKHKKYVCAGVMLMNLDYWRRYSLAERIVEYGYSHDSEIRFPDQDTINALCADSKVVLPMRYGIQESFFRDERFHTIEYRRQLIECVECPAIVHFAGCAPWIREFDWSVMHHRWIKYSRMLPWRVNAHYLTRGLNGLKVRIYRLLHSDPRKQLTEVRAREIFENIS